MSRTRETIKKWCDEGELPTAEEFYTILGDGHGRFVAEEGPVWDFKDEWPFSLSNSYFGGIARLICAFANTQGGVIVFGVHDNQRTGGHNKVKINYDKFNTALDQLLNYVPSLRLQQYDHPVPGPIDVLMVMPRPASKPPVQFQKRLESYPANVIWMRKNHEVKEATPADFPVLFCRINTDTNLDDAPDLDGSLPPNPATIKRFIGRVKVMEDLFRWLDLSDDPRTHLFGKGGSGKSTVAFEFAKIIRDHGANLKIYGGETIDSVIYLTAKEKSLHTSGGPEVRESEPDFSNEEELYRSILRYSKWIGDDENLSRMGIEYLKNEIKELFDTLSLLIVIDDVDTLTTKGIDPGSEFLFRVLCRANRQSKILYTLRNVPTQSLANAIEVPGLSDEEYDKFVDACVAQFRVPQPPKDFRKGRLSTLSERRPLVVESIVALVRTMGDYQRAADAFESRSGEGVREYVFQREWDSLKGDNPSRLLLCALSDLNQPTSAADLQTVLQKDSSGVSDAIGAVREMFLTTNEAGAETLFSLAPLTRSFVSSQKRNVVGYDFLHARVTAFKKNIHVSNPDVARVAAFIERTIPPHYQNHSGERWNEAWNAANQRNLPPHVTEHPVFRALYGYVAASGNPPKLTEAREAFEYCIGMKYEPPFKFLRTWYNAERQSGLNDGMCEKIADIVINGKIYEEREKVSMISRKSTSLYARGKALLVTNYTDALEMLFQALLGHLRAFRLNCVAVSPFTAKSEDYARNTAFLLLDCVARSDRPWEGGDIFLRLAESKEIYLDPIQEAWLKIMKKSIESARGKEAISRWRNRLRLISERLAGNDLWLDPSTRRWFIEAVADADAELARR